MSSKKILRPLLALVLCSPLLMGATTLKSGHPERYVVQKGDTLWDISSEFLDDPWLWPEIWYANPEIRNPHLIYPGDVISLTYVDGQPRLTITRDDRAGATVKLSPKIRQESLSAAVPTIPLEAIAPFLSHSRVVEEGELEAAPYVVAGADERVMSASNNQIYVRRLGDNPEHESYALVRQGDAYLDPTTKETLGYEAKYLGQAQLLRTGDPATLRITNSNREVLPGDRLLPPSEEVMRSNFYPKPPSADIDGRIIAVMDGVTQIGQYSVVVLNVGKEDGAEVGDVLAVYEAGESVRDPYSGQRADRVKLPDERAGELIVFRVFDKMSLGLIMEAESAMHTLDAVRNP